MPADTWSTGASYEPYVGRWSRLVAREFVSMLGVPTGASWLDVGCGTGALVQTILDLAAPREVTGVDPSPGFLAYAGRQIADRRARFDEGDARSLPYESGAFDAVVSGLVLNFVPDAAQAVAAMTSVSRGDGVVAAYVWDYADGMQLMRHFWDAAVRRDATVRDRDEARRFGGFCQPGTLSDVWAAAGLRDVETWEIVVATNFENFDDLWLPFLGGQGPAPSHVASLDDEGREALREEIRTALPIAADGSIHLTARAFAVRGMR
jgi:SAM-dependent methyltransferase